ncbi:putative NAD(P)-binding domain superfamily [Helianthus annuus]|nr:putative NAD(P)-binding domain superfamily [Helianthus annuus]KAJ0636949.1 putative NAD(P)-binding domain superfamily [Helianthus annuus]KAJ0814022.1 putative NAD(P)-binding domain superfamily [Helianthus annuus]
MICGATVIAVARCLLKAMGVDHVVDLDNVIESAKAFLKTRKLKGVYVLYDPVGGKLTKESMKLLNWATHILVIGFVSGEVPVIPANIALVKVNQLLDSCL